MMFFPEDFYINFTITCLFGFASCVNLEILWQWVMLECSLTLTRELTHALQGDPACRTTQVGRLPGSINCKPAKGNRVRLVYAQIQNMSEEAYMQLTKEHHTGRQGSVSSRSANGDRSASDWKMACEFFEQDPTATADTALTALSGRLRCSYRFASRKEKQSTSRLGQGYHDIHGNLRASPNAKEIAGLLSSLLTTMIP